MVRRLLGLPAAARADETDDEPVGPRFVDGGFGEDGQPLTHAARAKVVVRHGKKRRVVRLMIGDPFLYASGPEEAQACVKAGVGFEIVPGVSSVGAVPAYAGIPLTTKENREVTVVTCGGRGDRVDWKRYADDRTLVLLSAVGSIAEIADGAGRGRSPGRHPGRDDPGRHHHRAVHRHLDARAHRRRRPRGPDRAAGRHRRRPRSSTCARRCRGSRPSRCSAGACWCPAPRSRPRSLTTRLRGYGAVPEEVPTISVEPPRNPQQMDKAVRGLVEGRYEWIAFTSVNAVKAVREKFEEYGLDARAFSGLKIAAVGDKTAEAIAAWGLRADLVPSGEQSAAGLLADWPPYDDVLDPINRVFLPRADIATETLVAGLIDLGWECDDVTAYRTVRATPPPAPTRDAIKTGKFDAVVFTSSSTVRNLVGIAGKPHPSTVIAVIGPATAKTAEEHGLRVDVLAAKPDVELLVDGLADFGSTRRAAMIEAGQPVTKPSERPSSRRGARATR